MKTTKERQEAYRKRREAQGLKEVRGIWLKPCQHAEIKRIAKEIEGGKDE